MKKLILCLILIITAVGFCSCAKLPDLGDTPIIDVQIVDTGYKKVDFWNWAQGLACDGTYFYYAGHNDKQGKAADIHIIDAETFSEVKVLSQAGAMHSAELYYSVERESLFACSGGDGRKPYVYEIDPSNGAKKAEWYFDDLGEKSGGLITFDDQGRLILFTSSEDGAKIAFNVISLGENGNFTVLSSCYFSETDLGVPQGLEFYDGCVYLLCDPGKTVNYPPHYLYKLQFNDNGDSFKILAAFNIPSSVETEGICFAPDGNVYMGDADERIWKFSMSVAELASK